MWHWGSLILMTNSMHFGRVKMDSTFSLHSVTVSTVTRLWYGGLFLHAITQASLSVLHKLHSKSGASSTYQFLQLFRRHGTNRPTHWRPIPGYRPKNENGIETWKINVHFWPQTETTRSTATAKSTARPSCLVGVLYDIYRETNNRSTANQPVVQNWPWNLPNSAK